MKNNNNNQYYPKNIITRDMSNQSDKLGPKNQNFTFFDLISNTVVHDILQKDKGIESDYNDCWSREYLVKRSDSCTTMKNDSNKIAFLYLTDNSKKRLILPSSFRIKFRYIDHVDVSLRFVNLEGSFININLNSLDLKYDDIVMICYESNEILIYSNGELIKNNSFVLEEGKGYFTWRLSKKSYIKFNDFELYTENSLISAFSSKNSNSEYEEVLLKLNVLKERFDFFEKHTTEVLDSNNFLFNNLFLDYDLKAKNLLKSTQDLCSELLLFIGNICKKHDLKWWLDYGNLLGAIRHQNFIPWDDDVDIGMMRKEYNKLTEVIGDEIKEHELDHLLSVSYRKRKIENKKINSFLQIFDVHKTDYSGNRIFAGVDVFPYDYLKKYDEEVIEELYYNTKLDYYRELTAGKDYSSAYLGLNPEKVLKNYYSSLNLNLEEDNYIIPGVEGSCGPRNLYNLFIMKKEDVFPLKEVPYGEYTFYAPNNSHKYLNAIYGEYMEIPQTIRSHSRVNSLRYEEDVKKVFDEDFKILKNVNENFKF